ATVIAELRQLVTEQPLRDRLRGQLIVALYRSGRHAEALDAYQDYRRLLMDELGVEPSPGLRQLQRAGPAHDPSLGLPAGWGPALAPGPAPAPGRRDNLPVAISSFVGRAAETSEVTGLVDRHRLVTLTGAGGCGKTRLALEAGARRAGLHADGVWLAALAAPTPPDHGPPALAAGGGAPGPGPGPRGDRVAGHPPGRSRLADRG